MPRRLPRNAAEKAAVEMAAEQLPILTLERTNVSRAAEELLGDLSTKLERHDIAHTRETLEVFERRLEKATSLRKEACQLAKEPVKRDPGKAAEVLDDDHRYERQFQKGTGDVELLLAGLRASLPAPPAQERVVGGQPRGFGGGHHVFEKLKLPDFDGKRKNYPRFRWEWEETATASSYPPELELRELQNKLPEVVQAEVMIMKTATEFWSFLDKEYGGRLEMTSELVRSLMHFSPSKEARTDCARFL